MIEADRIVSPQVSLQSELSGAGREEMQDRAIRPKTLTDYVGQPAVREQMDIFIQAARKRDEALDHVLILSLIHI